MNQEFKPGDKVWVKAYSDDVEWIPATYVKYDPKSVYHHIALVEGRDGLPIRLPYMFCKKAESDEGIEFEYGELVEVCKGDNKPWVERHYVGIIPNLPWYYTMLVHCDPSSFNGEVKPWKQIRKIQKDKTKSPETSPTKKEESQLRDDANWAIEQALTIGHREYGEVVRAAKLIIESRGELIKFMKEGWTD